MNLNLNRPYNDICSPPQTPYLAFFCPDSRDWLFAPDNGGAVRPIVIECQAGLRSVRLSWTLHRNRLAKPFRSGVAEAFPGNRYRIIIDPSGLPAGFYDVQCTLETGAPTPSERPVTGVCVFGWCADEMPIRDTRPADFGEFWARAKASLLDISVDPRVESETTIYSGHEIDEYNVEFACLPPDYDPDGHVADQVESYKVSFAGPDGGRVYAWLAKPVGDGPFPGMLVLPGGGFTGRPRPLEHARHGYLAIDIQVHGQDVEPLDNPIIPGYYDGHICDPVEAYYYYNIHLRAVQAVSFLASRADVDATKIAAVGGSQGGRMSVVIAGLDQRIGAIVPCIVNAPNLPHLAWVADCNRHGRVFDPTTKAGAPPDGLSDGMYLSDAPPALDTELGRCFAYYDPMNYAPDIKCPALFNVGLIDNGSPPFSTWAVYNRIPHADKQVVTMPGNGHDWSAEFDRQAWRWLDYIWSRQAATTKPRHATANV